MMLLRALPTPLLRTLKKTLTMYQASLRAGTRIAVSTLPQQNSRPVYTTENTASGHSVVEPCSWSNSEIIPSRAWRLPSASRFGYENHWYTCHGDNWSEYITVGRHRLGPEYVQISTPQTWPHPNTMRASGARALGGMFCNARATHTAKLCPKNTGAKTQKCWDKKSCAGSAGAKKVYAGHASHTLAHCFQEMSACMIADI